METYESSISALGDPTRRAVFEKLRNGALAVGEIAEQLPVSRPAVSQHLRTLKAAGLVRDRQVGTRRLYELNPEGLQALRSYIDGLWEEALANYKAAADEEGRQQWSKRRSRRSSKP